MKMKKVVFSLCSVSACLVLVVATTLFDSSPVAGQSNSLVAGPDVRVINSSAEPVPVFDVDNQAFQPFQWFDREFNNIPFPLLDVPEGKRLVIEHVTSWALSEDDYFLLHVTTLVGDISGISTHSFPMSKIGVTSDGRNVYGVAAQTRIYADPGTTVRFEGPGFGGPIASSHNVSISGYLVDVP